MKHPIQPENGLSEILDGKQKRRDALMLAITLATPSELEGSAQRLKEVMKKPAGARRRRILPPEFSWSSEVTLPALETAAIDDVSRKDSNVEIPPLANGKEIDPQRPGTVDLLKGKRLIE